MAKDRVTIEIANWHKWNPRKDYRRPVWFAMSNDLLDHPDFADFTPLEFHALLYIFSQASKRNSPIVDVVALHASQRGVDKKTLFSTIEKLERNQTLAVIRTESVQNPNESVQNPYSTIQYNTGNTGNTIQEEYSCSDVLRTSEPDSPKQTYKVSTVEDLKSRFTEKVISSWVQLYCQEYVEREFTKAVVWLESNPKKNNKTKRGWVSFMAGWLDRGWSAYQAQQSTNRPGDLSGESREQRHARLLREHEELQERNRRVYGEGA